MRTSFFLILSAIPFISGYVGTPDPPYPIVPPGLKMVNDKPLLRTDLGFAQEFANLLKVRQVKMKSVNHSVYNGLFDEARQAAHFSTDQGTLDVVVFPDAVSKHIVVNRSYDAEGGVYLFEIRRTVNDEVVTVLDSPINQAITISGRYFILTDHLNLATTVRQALSAKS